MEGEAPTTAARFVIDETQGYCLGIDEAGRGPVMGMEFIASAFI